MLPGPGGGGASLATRHTLQGFVPGIGSGASGEVHVDIPFIAKKFVQNWRRHRHHRDRHEGSVGRQPAVGGFGESGQNQCPSPLSPMGVNGF